MKRLAIFVIVGLIFSMVQIDQSFAADDCDTEGKPISLTFQYTGGGCAASDNNQDPLKWECSGSIDPSLAITVATTNTGYAITPTTVNPGDTFTVDGHLDSNSYFDLTNSGVTESLKIHTSCSTPLGVGDVFGSLTLVGYIGENSGSVGDSVVCASTGLGLANITVELFEDFDNDGVADDPAIATTETDATGFYLFTGLEVALAGDTNTTAYILKVDVLDSDLGDCNFILSSNEFNPLLDSDNPDDLNNDFIFASPTPIIVTMQVVNPGTGFGSPSYFDTTISGGTALDGTYNGWSVDTDHTISYTTSYTANVYSSYGTLPAGLVEHPEDFDLVNWIINQGFVGQPSFCGGNYTYGDVQRAIWTLIEDNNSTLDLGSWSQCRVDEILAGALANGEGFVPDGTDYVALIFAPGSGVMVTIIEYLYDADGDGLNFDEEIDNDTDPSNPDSDGDGLSDGDEVTLGTDPTGEGSSDSDGDTIPDGSDPDILSSFVDTLSPEAVTSADGGTQQAVTSICDDIEQKILEGDCEGAIKKLTNLRKRLDGCGGQPDKNDWILDCDAQLEARKWVDLLIDNLTENGCDFSS